MRTKEITEEGQKAYLSRRQSIQQVLLVRHDQQWHMAQLLLIQQLLQLDASLLHPPAISGVDDVDQGIGLVIVVPPVRPDRLLSCGREDNKRILGHPFDNNVA